MSVLEMKEVEIKHEFSNGEFIIKYNVSCDDTSFHIQFQFNNLENFKRYELFADYDYIINSNKIFNVSFDILFDLIKDKPIITEREDRLNLSYNIIILKKNYNIIFEIPIIQQEGSDDSVINNDIVLIKQSLYKLKLDNKKLLEIVDEQDKKIKGHNESIKGIASYLFHTNNKWYSSEYNDLENLVKIGLDFTDISNVNQFVEHFSFFDILNYNPNLDINLISKCEKLLFSSLDFIGKNIFNSNTEFKKYNILFKFIDYDPMPKYVSCACPKFQEKMYIKIANYLIKYKPDVNKKYNYEKNISVIEYIDCKYIEYKWNYNKNEQIVELLNKVKEIFLS